MDLSLRQLRVIVAIAEEDSLTAAGHRLRLSQQSVSSLLRNAEAQLGVRLFERTTRKVVATPQCRALVEEIREALDRIDDAVAAVPGLMASEKPISLGVTPAVSYGELNLVLEHFHGAKIQEPEISEVWLDELVAGLIDGRFDGGLGIELPRTDSLDVWSWRRQRIDLLVAHDHPFGMRDSVDLSELDGMVIAMPGDHTNAGLNRRLMITLKRMGVRPRFSTAPRVSGPAPVLVERGEAVTVWLTGMDDKYLPAGLRRVKLTSPEIDVTTSYATAHDRLPRSPVAAEFLYKALDATKSL